MKRAIQKSLARLIIDNKNIEIPAMMGNASGTVKADRFGGVYVLLTSGEVLTVKNNRVPNVPRLRVVIGYDKSEPNRLQVLRVRKAYASGTPYPEIVNHADASHTWPGYDTVWIRGEQILPGLFIPYSGLTVHVTGFVYFINGSGFRQLADQSIDLTAYIPATGAKYLLIEVDADGVLQYSLSAAVDSREMLSPENIPIPSVDFYPLIAIKVYTGQTQFLKTSLLSDFTDLRWTGFSSGVSINLHWADLLDVPVVFPPDTSITNALYVRKFDFSSAPTVTDDFSAGYREDDMWHDTVTGKFYLLHDQTTGAAEWIDITASGGSGGGLTLLDLSAQVISGGETHFDLVTATEEIAVYINGLLEMPSNVTLDIDGLGFTLAFGVVLGDNVTVVLGATIGGGHVIQDNGTPMTARANLNFIGATLTDNSGADSTDVEFAGGGSSVASNLYMYSNYR